MPLMYRHTLDVRWTSQEGKCQMCVMDLLLPVSGLYAALQWMSSRFHFTDEQVTAIRWECAPAPETTFKET